MTYSAFGWHFHYNPDAYGIDYPPCFWMAYLIKGTYMCVGFGSDPTQAAKRAWQAYLEDEKLLRRRES